MQSYLGSRISTELPRISNSRLSPNTTSPKPPTLATGAHSEATITMYMTRADASYAPNERQGGGFERTPSWSATYGAGGETPPELAAGTAALQSTPSSF